MRMMASLHLPRERALQEWARMIRSLPSRNSLVWAGLYVARLPRDRRHSLWGVRVGAPGLHATTSVLPRVDVLETHVTQSADPLVPTSPLPAISTSPAHGFRATTRSSRCLWKTLTLSESSTRRLLQ